MSTRKKEIEKTKQCYQCQKVIGQMIPSQPEHQRVLGIFTELKYNDDFGGMKDVYYKELVNGKRKIYYNNACFCKDCIGSKDEIKFKES